MTPAGEPSPGAEPTPVEALLAGAAAARQVGPRVQAEEFQIIHFHVGDRRFAVPIQAVDRTERVPGVTPVPRAPAWVHGVASLRGGIVCVIDLRRLLTNEDTPAGSRSLLILRDDVRRLGVLSTSLPDFERVRASQLMRAPAAEADVYHGAVERDFELIGVVDPAKLFDHVDRALGGGPGHG